MHQVDLLEEKKNEKKEMMLSFGTVPSMQHLQKKR